MRFVRFSANLVEGWVDWEMQDSKGRRGWSWVIVGLFRERINGG